MNKEAEVAIILKDLKKKEVIYEYNESKKVPSASIIKVIIMMEAVNQVIKGNYRLEDIIEIKGEDKVEYSIITELKIDRFTFRDLITLMIIISDNTATNVLIDLLGIENINKFAKELGLKNTILQRKMMDFEAAEMGRQNYTSPLDMSKVLELIYRKEILNEEMCNLIIDILKRQNHKEMLPKYLPEEITIGHKTGELKNLNHDIGIIFLDHIDYILGVFVTSANSNLEAKEIIANVSKIIYEGLKT
ncbi:serine hydrolase [Wukongibacter baidiensis]|uniref:serine hydrolase n=1 Tax=Wukongibacter baidiensis TaxID=1723361 RepID=UPI003D7F6075